jgi:hypothetical protein
LGGIFFVFVASIGMPTLRLAYMHIGLGSRATILLLLTSQRQRYPRDSAARRANLGAALVGLIFALTSASPRGIGHARRLVPARRRRLCRGRGGGEQPAAFQLSSGRAAAIPLTRRVRGVGGRSGQNRLVRALQA